MHFRPLETFLFRAPALNWRTVRPFLNKKKIHEAIFEPDIRDALFSASPGFVKRLKQSTEPLSENEKYKLAQYLIRMSCRSTPFGFLAGVGVGSIGSQDYFPPDFQLSGRKIVFPSAHSHVLTRARTGTVPPYDRDRFALNPTLISSNGRITFYSLKLLEKMPAYFKMKYSASGRYSFFLNKLKQPATFEDLISLISMGETNNRVAAEKHLTEMIQEGIIVRMTTPLFECTAPAVSFRQFSKVHPPEMPRNSCLIFKDSCSISRKSVEKLFSAAAISLKLNLSLQSNESAIISNNLKDFLESNSPHSPVPLLSITENLLGKVYNDRSQALENKTEIALGRRLASARLEIGKVWQLNEADLRELGLKEDVRLPPSVSILTGVQPNGKDWTLYAQSAAYGSASMLHGRFGPWLPAIDGLIQEIHQHEQKAWGDAIVADLEHLLPSPMVDVTARTTGFDAYIDTYGAFSATKTRIPLSDLAVMLDDSRNIQLISMSLKKRVIPHLTSAFDFRDNGHFLVRLLSELAPCKSTPFWKWGKAREIFEYFPRVQLGEVVLSPATWAIQGTQPKELWPKLKKLGVPKKVYLSDRDQRLFLDLELPLAIGILEGECQKNKRIYLEETLGQNPDKAFELVLTGFSTRAVSDPVVKAQKLQRAYSGGSLIPGGNSLYWKIVVDPNDFDYTLTKLFRGLRILRSPRRNFTFFFTKYRDSEPHIRFRLLNKNKEHLRKVEEQGRILLNQMRKDRLIHRVDVLTYERELDRFQGVRGCELFEHLSSIDSMMVLRMLTAMESSGLLKSLPFTLHLGAELVLIWLNVFIQDIDKQIDFCRQRSHAKVKDMGRLRPLTTEEMEQAAKVLVAGKSQLQRNMGEWINQIPGLRSNEDRQSFAASLIHMSLNRWCFDSGVEDAFFYRHTLRHLMKNRLEKRERK